MGTEIVRAMDVDVNALTTVAQLLAQSGYFETTGNAAAAVAQMAVKVLAGREMGFGPFASVQGIYLIKGKPSVSANLMASAVKNSPRYDYRVRKMDAKECVLEFFERDINGKLESLGESSFTAEQAAVAGVQNMNKFPRNMLFARALSNGVRWYCPNVFAGNAVYIPEELGAEVDGEGEIVTVQATPAPKPNGNGNGRAVTPVTDTQPEAEQPCGGKGADWLAMMDVGKGYFTAKGWAAARPWLIEKWTAARTPENVRTSSKDLTPTECKRIIAYMRDNNESMMQRWAKHLADNQAKAMAAPMAQPEMSPDGPEMAVTGDSPWGEGKAQ